MASAHQIKANRANARLSTGPADTSRTKFNGTQHGLTSKQTVIPGESQAEYDTFQAGMLKDLRPGSETEKLLAERIIAAAWRIRRFTRIETAFFNSRIDAHLEAHPDQAADAALANLFNDPAEAQKMRLFLRYQTAVQREYDAAVRQFDKARKERAQRQFAEQAAALARARAESASTPEPALPRPVQPTVGFASYDLAAMTAPPIRPRK